MNTIPNVSIVIPVYKAEPYIEDCVQSILQQTFTDFELLLVDDGSPDNSGALCEELAAKDQRIKVFHKPNGGATSARKYGVEQATGEWIMFSDADDTMPNGALQDLCSHNDGNVDIVAGTILYKTKRSHIKTRTEENTIPYDEYIHFLLNRQTYYGPCAKLIKSKLFEGFKWNDDFDVFLHEDLLMLVELAAKSKGKIAVSNDYVHYVCFDKEGSLSTRKMSYDGWKKVFLGIERNILSIADKQSSLYSDYINYVLLNMYDCLLTQSINIPQDDFALSLLNEAKRISIQEKNIKAYQLISKPFYRFLFCKYRGVRMYIKKLVKK